MLLDTFREIKLSLPGFMNDGIRYIWYSYYLFYGILISFLLWIGYSASYAFLTRPCPRWMKGIFAGNLLLAFLVMTNDFHQLVFTLPAGLAAAYSRHGYGPLYFILAAVYGMELLAVNGVLCYTSLSRKVSHPARMILPLAVVVGYGIYVVGYALPGSPFQPSELVLVTIWTVLLWLELVTRGKFVPANEGYIDFSAIPAWPCSSMIMTGTWSMHPVARLRCGERTLKCSPCPFPAAWCAGTGMWALCVGGRLFWNVSTRI